MQYVSDYSSPLGKILLAADNYGLTGLWFYEQKYFASTLEKETATKETEIIKSSKCWLDIYFSGNNPDFFLPIHFIGTEFQISVWEILAKIPYGQTVTYKDIAKEIAKQKGISKMSAQAVGYAVGRNPISIIVPCHRVLGSNKSLTGYAGGLDKKQKLLDLEANIL